MRECIMPPPVVPNLRGLWKAGKNKEFVLSGYEVDQEAK